MKKPIYAVVCSIFLVFSLQAEAQTLKLVRTYKDGSLYKAGTFNVLVLKGDYATMGEQYGTLLSATLHSLYQDGIENNLIKNGGLTIKEIREDANDFYRFYPLRYKAFMQGVAKGSGLTLDQVIILNGIEGSFPKEKSAKRKDHCSGIAVWNGYTKNGELIFGRNYDYPSFFRNYSKTLTITVLHPTDSSLPIAFITYAGTFYATNVLNSNHLFLELNNGMIAGGMIEYTNRRPLMASILAEMQDSATLEELDVAFQTTNSHSAYIINVADTKQAFSYEWPVFGLKKRQEANKGLLVATNYFVNPAWHLAMPPTGEPGGFSIERREHLINLANQNKGKITPQLMMNILDTPLEQGGATFPKMTIYQLVVIPQTLTVWLKAPDVQDWTEINLTNFLNQNQKETKCRNFDAA